MKFAIVAILALSTIALAIPISSSTIEGLAASSHLFCIISLTYRTIGIIERSLETKERGEDIFGKHSIGIS